MAAATTRETSDDYPDRPDDISYSCSRRARRSVSRDYPTTVRRPRRPSRRSVFHRWSVVSRWSASSSTAVAITSASGSRRLGCLARAASRRGGRPGRDRAPRRAPARPRRSARRPHRGRRSPRPRQGRLGPFIAQRVEVEAFVDASQRAEVFVERLRLAFEHDLAGSFARARRRPLETF